LDLPLEEIDEQYNKKQTIAPLYDLFIKEESHKQKMQYESQQE
jgi:hypothetical protein